MRQTNQQPVSWRHGCDSILVQTCPANDRLKRISAARKQPREKRGGITANFPREPQPIAIDQREFPAHRMRGLHGECRLRSPAPILVAPPQVRAGFHFNTEHLTGCERPFDGVGG